ncbi:hypothetical protein THARTR1_02719 [Trichoderma harzianum]|uniref:Zn(2)-C6 fungal-type domain-containing protein n=1 Tax=Trichoderma harzianum TaxID=5544 RepID=A0A2K0UHL8_TRIHA|nr:hypothetical protein THARTR1_02719 [Trichoderma harzianum]
MDFLISKDSRSIPDRTPALRRRACIPCTSSKRRCDMTRPSCERCLDKQVACRYSSARLYARRGIQPKPSGVTEAEASLNSPFSALFESGDDECDASYNRGNYHRSDHATNSSDSDSAPWFLQAEHWVIHYHDDQPSPPPYVRSSMVRQYILCVKKWLQQWLECGHCPIIHKSLFADTKLPPCLQDAYAALAVYSFKNDQNEDVVMQHIEDKANSLLEEHSAHQDLLVDPFVAPCSLTTIQHLARVLSLIIYQFIRLFDGNIRHRAQAEKHIPLLKSWTCQLWSSVNIDVTVQNTFGGDYLVTQENADATVKLWRTWLLMESVRRAWKVSAYMRCIYYVFRDGTAACEGTIDFTARRGLWDASSAAVWRRLLEQKDPLFTVPCASSWLLDAMTPKDIDAFGLATMSITVDSNKLDSWIANSSDMRLEEKPDMDDQDKKKDASIETLKGRTDPVLSVAWSPDRSRLASASSDYTVKIWNPDSQECLLTLEGHVDAVTSVV